MAAYWFSDSGSSILVPGEELQLVGTIRKNVCNLENLARKYIKYLIH